MPPFSLPVVLAARRLPSFIFRCCSFHPCLLREVSPLRPPNAGHSPSSGSQRSVFKLGRRPTATTKMGHQRAASLVRGKAETDPGRMRLQHCHRRVGQCRWDESLQSHIDETTGGNVPWENAAQDLYRWKGQEVRFVARITCKLATKVQLIGAQAPGAEWT